jgi:hypothetical protein
MILKVHTKLTVKTTKRGQGAAKLSNKEFNALPWHGMERHLQNIIPLNSKVYLVHSSVGTTYLLKTSPPLHAAAASCDEQQ